MANAERTCPACSGVFPSAKIGIHRKDMHCLEMTYKEHTLHRNPDTDAFDCVKSSCPFSAASRQAMYNHLRVHPNLSKPKKISKQRQLLLTQLMPASKQVSRPPEDTGPSNDDDILMDSDPEPWENANESEAPLEPRLPLPIVPEPLRRDSVMRDISPESQSASQHFTTVTNNVPMFLKSSIVDSLPL
jgi:hypothetical protein